MWSKVRFVLEQVALDTRDAAVILCRQVRRIPAPPREVVDALLPLMVVAAVCAVLYSV